MHYGIITQQAPFDMDYRVLYLRHSSPWQVEIKLMSEQIIHIGLCLPSACNSEEVKNLAQDYVAGGMFTENDIFDIRPEVVYMKDLQLREEFFERASFRLLVACVLVTGALMLCAQQLTATKKLAPSSEEPDPALAPAESELYIFCRFSVSFQHPLRILVWQAAWSSFLYLPLARSRWEAGGGGRCWAVGRMRAYRVFELLASSCANQLSEGARSDGRSSERSLKPSRAFAGERDRCWGSF